MFCQEVVTQSAHAAFCCWVVAGVSGACRAAAEPAAKAVSRPIGAMMQCMAAASATSAVIRLGASCLRCISTGPLLMGSIHSHSSGSNRGSSTSSSSARWPLQCSCTCLAQGSWREFLELIKRLNCGPERNTSRQNYLVTWQYWWYLARCTVQPMGLECPLRYPWRLHALQHVLMPMSSPWPRSTVADLNAAAELSGDLETPWVISGRPASSMGCSLGYWVFLSTSSCNSAT